MASTSAQSHNLPSLLITSETRHGNAVEMNTLDNSSAAAATSSGLLNDISIPSASMATPTIDTYQFADREPASESIVSSHTAATTTTEEIPKNVAAPDAIAGPASTENATATSNTSQLSRLDSEAIGPSTDSFPAVPVDSPNPVCIITLLLTSGARHPYKLDEKYLAKRNVEVPALTESGKKDPFSISVYTLKELILREWREEWESQPSSPSSIRLIHFGRLLDDKTPLKECRFNADTPNVVHMAVKPQDLVDDEEAGKGKTGTREREGTERTPGCRCIVM